ncbi:MAG TPA: nuclear transport factor 2 family protein [Caulobacteraceae bacterium]|jgi:ketosteroid isomerase-like protein|nr:nuclear transport factor 2 family protein [Caulobacteraceae bacterium]
MRSLIIAAGALALCTGPLVVSAARAAPADDIAATINQFIAAFDKGDIKGAAATHDTANLTIIDEVAPYVWKGPKAFDGWLHDLTSGDAKAGISGESVAISPPSRVEVDGDNAYAVAPAVYSFKDHGAAMHEPAQMTFALHKGAVGWKITAWTWTGPKPTPAS